MMINNYRQRRLLVAALTGAVLTVAGAAQGEEFQLESAVMDSVSGKSLGVAREKGPMPAFFTAQKAMVYKVLQSSGISLESLPPDVRARLEKFQTTNMEAFKAFSMGLDLKDEGKFAEAKAFFEKAAELDPNFKLAEEMKVSMPNVDLPNLLNLRSVVRDSAKTAVDSGKRQVEVDLSRAMAALMSGQNVVAVAVPASSQPNNTNNGYTSNPPGSGSDYAPRKVIGTAFSYASAGAGAPAGTAVGIASTNEWTVDQYKINGTALQSVGTTGEFVAHQGGATGCCSGSYSLGDGSTVSWGAWKSAPGASASVTVSGLPLTAPTLGSDFLYMVGDATKQMPFTGTAVFTPAAGFLNNVVGNVSVNFATRQVSANNLGFTLAGLTFSQLNGTATYDTRIASGFFKGNYTSGSCAGCSAFSPTASAFTGNFVGAEANGVIMSHIMQNGAGTVSGVHLFAR